MEEFWKWCSVMLAGIVLSETSMLWAGRGKPSFTQVKAMIAEHAENSCFSKHREAIMLRLASQDKILEKLDRHLETVREDVAEIKLDVELHRHARAEKAKAEHKA